MQTVGQRFRLGIDCGCPACQSAATRLRPSKPC